MDNQQEDAFGCQFCDYESRHFYKLIKHLKHNHVLNRDFKITCGVNECRRTYKMVRKLVNHIRSKHKDFADQHLPLRRNLQNLPGNGDQSNDGDSDHQELEEEEEEQILPEEYQIDYKHLVSHLFVEAREKYKVSGKACEFIGLEVRKMMEKRLRDLSSQVSTVCRREGIDVPELHDIISEFNDPLAEAVGKYNTQYNFENNKKRNSTHFVAPEKVVLGMKNESQRTEDTYQYVPILQSLKALLQHDDILAQVFQGHQCGTGRISSFTDAQLYNDHEFFKRYPKALQIYLYFDEFKVANPLRNRGEYKLGGFYFLLGNLEPKYRSKQHIVQLACLCKVTDLKHYGLEVILARLISDLKTLETDGIEFYHDGRKFHFHGTLALVVGDNLAQHFMGGFPENFSTSLRLCRFCTGTNELVKTSLREDDFTWRNQEGYNEQANTVEVHPHLSSVYWREAAFTT
ncbi:uncharacterized protein [Amphiura filiformis]|uniref:uncharacterized protein n=1 Tax=Amphiura filiformis TaxID=82378 RepID=UPI003B21E5A2